MSRNTHKSALWPSSEPPLNYLGNPGWRICEYFLLTNPTVALHTNVMSPTNHDGSFISYFPLRSEGVQLSAEKAYRRIRMADG